MLPSLTRLLRGRGRGRARRNRRARRDSSFLFARMVRLCLCAVVVAEDACECWLCGSMKFLLEQLP